MNNEKYKGAVAIVMRNPQGLIYLSLRKNTETWNDCYAFAGGRVDFDDPSPKFAAHREIFEETELYIPTYRFQLIWEGSTETAEPEHIYMIELTEFEIPQNTEPDKHDPWKLYTIEEARKLKVIPLMLEIFDVIEKNNL